MSAIRYGVSFSNERICPDARKCIFVRFPIFIHYGTKYNIRTDHLEKGWWQLDVLISLDVYFGGIGLKLLYGWMR